MDDKDIKIFQTSKQKAMEQMTEVYDTLNYHKDNGNFSRAVELGRLLSTLSPAGNDGLALNVENHFEFTPTQGILFQLKVLLTFAAETVVKENIQPDFLSIMVINTMHDEISHKHPNFFKSMTDCTAYTFYSLALQKGGDISENIGQAFAMLCDAGDQRESFVQAGKAMWNTARRTVEEEIKHLSFIK